MTEGGRFVTREQIERWLDDGPSGALEAVCREALILADERDNWKRDCLETLEQFDVLVAETAQRPRRYEVDATWADEPSVPGPGAYQSPKLSVVVTVETAEGDIHTITASDAQFNIRPRAGYKPQ